MSSTVRRGLPRVPGGQPWPPADTVLPEGVEVSTRNGDAPGASAAQAAAAAAPPVPADAAFPVASAPSDAVNATGEQVRSSQTPGVAAADPAFATSEAGGSGAPVQIRRGLPRVADGEPWPPASVAAAASAGIAASAGVAAAGAAAAPAASASPVASATADVANATGGQVQSSQTPGVPTQNPAFATSEPGVELRRGLPRVAGGEPWPPAGSTATVVAPAPAAAPATPAAATDASPVASAASDAALPTGEPARAAVAAAPAPAGAVAVASGPLPFRPSVWPGKYAFTPPKPRPEPERVGPFTRGQWAGAVIVAGAGLLFAAGMVVLAVRWLLSLEPMQDFLATYPGEYHLPETAPVGLPAWIGWQHFFNVFLMVLVIRSGLQIRREKRPDAFWTPKWNQKRKISLTIWFHQSLDILWLLNGVIFVVLLFLTGQWMRIVPTSWEVFPNALSAALQYASLDWPTENGWVNYNSIQQLAYFATVFIAAPLAAITGVRMSGIWPKNATALSKAYPIEWARAVHFPVMLYFVLFIVVHVTLVFATGALRNLNHMYAAQGSVDPNAYADNWAGFWIFVVSLLVIAGAWVAARPLVLAPIARLFGSVSSR